MALVSFTAVKGQSTDSLVYALNNDFVKEDSNRLNHLFTILTFSDDADTILKYSEMALSLSEKLHEVPKKPTVFKGIGYLNSGRLDLALEYFLKALAIIRKVKPRSNFEAAHLGNIGNSYFDKNEFAKALSIPIN